jgi:hypothetical protein
LFAVGKNANLYFEKACDEVERVAVESKDSPSQSFVEKCRDFLEGCLAGPAT